jgi:2-polyprenyl-3-methyl-5-hydroxy-6-metoxy-1,4-benzoquinol methylase
VEPGKYADLIVVTGNPLKNLRVFQKHRQPDGHHEGWPLLQEDAFMTTHQESILDQFTRQAIPFNTSPGIKDEIALNYLIEASGAGPGDTVLDVACGGGIVVCGFARVVKHATGIDLTPAMIERSKQLQKEKGLTNVTWKVGDVLPLPFPDASFSIVTSRFAFHHFLDPFAVLAR